MKVIKKTALALAVAGCSLTANISHADWALDVYSPARGHWGGTYDIGQCERGVQRITDNPEENGVSSGSYYAIGAVLDAILPNGNVIAIPLAGGVLAAECESDNSSIGLTFEAKDLIEKAARNTCINSGLANCDDFGTGVADTVALALTNISQKPLVGMYDYFNGAQWKWFGNWVYYSWVDSRQTWLRSGEYAQHVKSPKSIMDWNNEHPQMPDTYPVLTFMAGMETTLDKPILEGFAEASVTCGLAIAEKYNTHHHKNPVSVDIYHDAGYVGNCSHNFAGGSAPFGFTSVGFNLVGGLHTEYLDNTLVTDYTQGNTLVVNPEEPEAEE